MYFKFKIFLIFNTACFGDVLICNTLCQNIKRLYPEARVVFIVDKPFYDAAKYQQGVDDVIIWDRNGKDGGFWNFLKFIFNFPYKKIFAAFPIYSGDRPIILAKLLGAKFILGEKQNILKHLLKNKYEIKKIGSKTQEQNISLLSGITKEKLTDCPMKYIPPEITSSFIKELENKEFIVLNPKSSRADKDIPDEKVCELIEKLPYKVVLIGKGKTCDKLSNIIESKSYNNVINLIGKTSIVESAQVIQLSKACISVDTGMLHMACALNKPTVGIYYNENLSHFEPDEHIYPLSKCLHNDNTDEIIKTLDLIAK